MSKNVLWHGLNLSGYQMCPFCKKTPTTDFVHMHGDVENTDALIRHRCPNCGYETTSGTIAGCLQCSDRRDQLTVEMETK